MANPRPEPPLVNKVCATCIYPCKQSGLVSIVGCPRYRRIGKTAPDEVKPPEYPSDFTESTRTRSGPKNVA